MPAYCAKLLPPRPDFMATATPEENAAIMAHVGYWKGLLDQGIAVAFGPVLDPAGGWGVGLLRVETEAQLQEILAQDPAITAHVGFRFEAHPMAQLVAAEPAAATA